MRGTGGDNVGLIWDAGGGGRRAWKAWGRGGAAADLDGYRSRFGAGIPPRGGPAALTVPGTISGWWEAHAYSREVMHSPLAWSALLEDAIAHAREGFPVSTGQRRVTAATRDLFGDTADADVRRTLRPRFIPILLSCVAFTSP